MTFLESAENVVLPILPLLQMGTVAPLDRQTSPQQSKLVYDIEVCSQYIGQSDSDAAVIEVGLLSGFDPVDGRLG
ncbi:hypothetical protein MTO96_024038 [Rhipicephalus appendiculatus]